MTITFQKRQKEMKRLEKAREKMEKRAQRKLAKRNGTEAPQDIEENPTVIEPETPEAQS
jgi:hypothetical protein